MCEWRDMECALFLALILLITCLWRADRTGGCLFLCTLLCTLFTPSFLWPPPPGCQSLNILCVCRDARVISVSLSCGWPQTATAETVEIHTHTQYMLCVCGVWCGWGGGHIAFYVPSELYIEADHTTVV